MHVSVSVDVPANAPIKLLVKPSVCFALNFHGNKKKIHFTIMVEVYFPSFCIWEQPLCANNRNLLRKSKFFAYGHFLRDLLVFNGIYFCASSKRLQIKKKS